MKANKCKQNNCIRELTVFRCNTVMVVIETYRLSLCFRVTCAKMSGAYSGKQFSILNKNVVHKRDVDLLGSCVPKVNKITIGIKVPATHQLTSLAGTDRDVSVVLLRKETGVLGELSPVRPAYHMPSLVPTPGIEPGLHWYPMIIDTLS